MYDICFYRDGALIHEAQRTSRDAAELVAMDATKTRGGADVTIYRNGKALKGWHMRRIRRAA